VVLWMIFSEVLQSNLLSCRNIRRNLVSLRSKHANSVDAIQEYNNSLWFRHGVFGIGELLKGWKIPILGSTAFGVLVVPWAEHFSIFCTAGEDGLYRTFGICDHFSALPNLGPFEVLLLHYETYDIYYIF
jgi:hypothetical protein